MTKPSPREDLKAALKSTLRSRAGRTSFETKTKGLSVVVVGTDRKNIAELSFEFLARVDAIYLVTQVTGGRLADMVSAANMPSTARRSLAAALYFKSTLSEKQPRFTTQQGGAEYFSATTDVVQLAERLVGRAFEHYLPSIETILSITPALSGLIVDEAQFFSFPLTALAILEQLGQDATFSHVEGTKQARALSPKESSLDVRSLVRLRWADIARAGA